MLKAYLYCVFLAMFGCSLTASASEQAKASQFASELFASWSFLTLGSSRGMMAIKEMAPNAVTSTGESLAAYLACRSKISDAAFKIELALAKLYSPHVWDHFNTHWILDWTSYHGQLATKAYFDETEVHTAELSKISASDVFDLTRYQGFEDYNNSIFDAFKKIIVLSMSEEATQPLVSGFLKGFQQHITNGKADSSSGLDFSAINTSQLPSARQLLFDARESLPLLDFLIKRFHWDT